MKYKTLDNYIKVYEQLIKQTINISHRRSAFEAIEWFLDIAFSVLSVVENEKIVSTDFSPKAQDLYARKRLNAELETRENLLDDLYRHYAI